IEIDLHLTRRRAADRDRAEVAEPTEAAHLDADGVRERLGQRLDPGGCGPRVHHRREGGRVARARLLPRRGRRDDDLAERLLRLGGPRPRDRECQENGGGGAVRRLSTLPPSARKGGGGGAPPPPRSLTSRRRGA